MTDVVGRLLGALEFKPELLYGVLRKIAEGGGQVVGPWTADPSVPNRWFRMDARGEPVARVVRDDAGEEEAWPWQVLDTSTSSALSGASGTLDEARVLVDGVLRVRGYMLVGPVDGGASYDNDPQQVTPWMTTGEGLYTREDRTGKQVAVVSLVDRALDGRQVFVGRMEQVALMNKAGDIIEFPTPERAMAAMDGALRRMGYVLDPVPSTKPPTKVELCEWDVTAWLPEDGSGRHLCCREDAKGAPIAWVGRDGGRGYYAQVEGHDVLDEPGGRTAWFRTLDEAKAATDENLVGLGYVL